MTVPLKPDSPRRDAARRFGVELRKAMKLRRVGARPLSAAAGVAMSAINAWRAGQNLPTLATAILVSEALHAPALATIVREARTVRCVRCGIASLNEGGQPKRYCSPACRQATARGREALLAPRRHAVDAIRDELLRPGAMRKQHVGRALTVLDARPDILAERALDDHAAAVEAFCRGCEPTGYCRQPECELRPVSPLPLAVGHREARAVEPLPGRWGREGAREAYSEAMRVSWADPERREAHLRGIRAADAWRKANPEEHARRVSAGRRRSA